MPRVGRLAADPHAADELAGHAFDEMKPRKSLICVLAISTAMPLVKPTTTRPRNEVDGASPCPSAPSTTSRTPAIIVHEEQAGDAVA